jgi:hypothetical protein
VAKGKHPYRLTYTKMSLFALPATEPLGKSSNLGKRARWHILDDYAGKTLCQRVDETAIDTHTIYANAEGERICRNCHHEFSWTPLPHDIEERDCGYETLCWIWIRGLDDDGYGQFGRKGRHLGTHRAAYIAEYGEPPEGYVVHHMCGQSACLRPDHLEAMPRSEHIRLHKPELAPGSAALKRTP